MIVERAARNLMAKLENFFEEYGAEHLEDCPEDSTCECPLVVDINSAFSELRSALEDASEARNRALPPADQRD